MPLSAEYLERLDNDPEFRRRILDKWATPPKPDRPGINDFSAGDMTLNPNHGPQTGSTGGDLEQWKSAARTELTASDDARERRILEAIREGGNLKIRYWRMGRFKERQVVPQRLFRVEGWPGTYLEAHCQLRDAPRTFALDRMLLPGEPQPRRPEQAPPEPAPTPPRPRLMSFREKWKEEWGCPCPLLTPRLALRHIRRPGTTFLWVVLQCDGINVLVANALKSLGPELIRQARFAAADIDEEGGDEMVQRLNMRSTPLLLEFRDGEEVWRGPAVMRFGELEQRLRKGVDLDSEGFSDSKPGRKAGRKMRYKDRGYCIEHRWSDDDWKIYKYYRDAETMWKAYRAVRRNGFWSYRMRFPTDEEREEFYRNRRRRRNG